MRIALFHNLPSGGAKRAVCEWTRGLAAGHTVDVYSLSTADHDFCDLRPFAHSHRVLEFQPHRPFRSPYGRLDRLQYWRDLRALTRLGRRIAAQIDRAGSDVVFAHPCRHTSIPTLLRFLTAPAVYYLHEPVGDGFPPPVPRPYARRPRPLLDELDPLLRLQRRAVDRARRRSLAHTRLLANSEFTRHWMQATHAVDAPVCYCGVDVDVFQPPPAGARAGGVISVGELTPRKGFDFLIDSLALLSPARRPALTLVCNGGTTEETGYVQALAERRGVELRLRWQLPTAALAAEYGAARLCLYAPHAEPLGLVPLEAMACATPVVAVAEGGVPETITDGVTGRLLPRDPRAFSAAVDALLADASARQRLGANGRERVCRDWTWPGAVARLERVLGDVVRSGGKARAQ